MNYKNYIESQVDKAETGTAIYTDDVADAVANTYGLDIDTAKKIVNVNMKRLFDAEKIERFQKGIYYRTKKTPFGNVRLNPQQIAIERYIKKGDKRIGYETDDSFINKLGLTTQIPKDLYIAVNNHQRNGYQKNTRYHVAIRKPRLKVTDKNYKYLQILDVIENRNKANIDAANPDALIFNFIEQNGLDFTKLVGYAAKYYNKNTLTKIENMAQGVIE